eukprot:1741400-Prymnesium_polylepis.1
MQIQHGNGVHTWAEEEVTAFVSLINRKLGDDKQLSYLLPIPPDNPNALFPAMMDGVLLCKLLNIVRRAASPPACDTRFAPHPLAQLFHTLHRCALPPLPRAPHPRPSRRRSPIRSTSARST